jgi:hypothetical protein
MRHFILYIVLILSLTACHDAQKKQHLKEVDALLAQIDSIEKTYKYEHADSIPIIIHNITNVELRIKNNYKTDTIDMVLAQKMDAYKRARKQLKPMGNVLSKVIEGSKEERIALEALRKDIESGAGERDKYAEYIAFERQKVQQINELLKEMLETQRKSFEAYYTYHEELDQFATSLLPK